MQTVHTYIWVLWDLIAIGVFFHRVRECARRGFVSTVIRLLVYVAATVAATMTYMRITEFLYDNIIHDAVQAALTRSFNNMMNGIGPSKDIVHSIPLALRMLIGFKRGEVAAIPTAEASDMAGQVIDMALKQPLTSILHGVSFLLIFTLTAYAMRYIARLFTGINRIPVLGTLNAVAGGVAGVVEGMITLFVAGFVMRIVIALSGEVWWWLNSSVIQSTYIWRQFF